MIKILREISDAEQSEIQQGRIIPGNMVRKVRPTLAFVQMFITS